jgi:hypothetical protein
MFRQGVPWHKWSRIAPKRSRLELEAKPFDKHGSSIDAAQRGSRQICGCPLKQQVREISGVTGNAPSADHPVRLVRGRSEERKDGKADA